ncbi:hypothetical protein LptCag_1521 [Leptospirillum ferriphilum]|uniref:Uncharacterized protein n=1 Tax=Leptospirillum ferriphilum TaxID=178606 RepID=A0A094YKQ3_9BACT|nr:hypothetical protein LptCag_1521 [Leptospirillum ferriphilum]
MSYIFFVKEAGVNISRTKIVLIFLFTVFCFGGGAEFMNCDTPHVPYPCWKDITGAFFQVDVLGPILIIAVLAYLLVVMERWNTHSFKVKN